MKTIRLTKGYEAIVNNKDYEFLSQWKWCYSHGYAVRSTRVPYKHFVYMHREVLKPPAGKYIDHINSNPLDNRRTNLRVCTMLENSRNRGKQSNNTSGFKGVKYEKRFNRWYAYTTYLGKYKHLGSFKSAEEAAKAYDSAIKTLHGEFANPNFKVGG